MSWLDNIDYEQAIKEILNDQKRSNDFLLDPLRFEDLQIRSVKNILIDRLKNKMKNGYSMDDLLMIDVPKSNFILRPTARPNIEDWIVYHAIVNLIIKSIYKIIPDSSYSFKIVAVKYSRNKDKETNSRIWLQFSDKCLELAKSYKYFLTTDIASFFENISHKILKERLLQLNADEDYSKTVSFLVENVLSKWGKKEKVEGFSLPQGPSASSMLADVYLYEMDKKMLANKKIRYFRYMDDIRIFAHSLPDLKIALMELVRVLRHLKLILNAKKTNIYDIENNKDTLKNVFDPVAKQLDVISNAFKTKDKQMIVIVIPMLETLYSIIKENNSAFTERYLRFYIPHYINLMKWGIADQDRVTKLCIEFIKYLENRPYITKYISWFLVAASRYNSNNIVPIKEKTLEFLFDKNRNIYEWQEMYILDILRQINHLTPREISKLRNYNAKHPICEGYKWILIGQHGNHDDLERMAELLRSSKCSGENVRSLCLSIQNINDKLKRELYALPIVPEYFREYLRKQKKRKYGWEFNLQREILREVLFEEYY